MQEIKHKKVLLYAAAIIMACTAVLIVSVQIAFGAEETKVVAEPSESVVTATVSEAADEPLPTETPVATAAAETVVESQAAEPGAQYITEESAVNIFTQTLVNVFEKTADDTDITASFDSQGHTTWAVKDDTFSCYIEAISGDVICCMNTGSENEYSGESITLGEFDSDSFCSDIYDDPDNIYIQTATNIVNNSLANGRRIDHVEIDGIQFCWDDNSRGFDPAATGTAMVDCHVYMETGLSYTLSLWGGTDALEVSVFYSHPTWNACQWGYYFEEDAPSFDSAASESATPESAVEWSTAAGVIAEPTPVPTATP